MRDLFYISFCIKKKKKKRSTMIIFDPRFLFLNRALNFFQQKGKCKYELSLAVDLIRVVDRKLIQLKSKICEKIVKKKLTLASCNYM